LPPVAPTQQGTSASKSEFNCVNIQTKEQFKCKVVVLYMLSIIILKHSTLLCS